MITLSLPFPPSVNRLWRASKGGGVYKSKAYSDWRKAAVWTIVSQARGLQPIRGAYKLTLKLVRPDRRYRDLDNMLKAVSDALTDSGIIVDDRLCEWIEARWVEDGDPCIVIVEDIDGKGFA